MGNRDKMALLAVLICTSLCVSHKFQNGLVYDDVPVIKGPLIHHPERLWEVFGTHAMLAQGSSELKSLDTYRPISIASFFWDAWLSGESTWSYHLTNLLAHLGSVACVFALARQLLPTASTAAISFAALFFALSPQLSEAHIWINGRSDPLATAFGFSALLVWRKALRDGQAYARALHLFAAVLFLVGLMCKEVLLLATPAIFFFPDAASPTFATRLRRTLGFAAASLLYLGLRTHALKGMRASAWPSHAQEALANMSVLWLDGLVELIAPTKLYLRSMRDEYAALTHVQRMVITLVVLGIALTTFLIRRRAPVFAWSMAWFALTLAPAAMIASLMWPGFGRYLYLPCAGLSLGTAELAMRAEHALTRSSTEDPKRQRGLIYAMRGAIMLYLLGLFAQLATVTSDYRSNETLYMSVIRAVPDAPHGYGWLGLARSDAHDPVHAIPLLERAIAMGGFEPRYARALIRSKMRMNDMSGAEAVARDAVDRSRHHKPVVGEMRSLLMQTLALRSPIQAMAVLCECLDFDPQSTPCRAAPAWMVAPNLPNRDEYMALFARFEKQCRSKAAVTAFKEVTEPLAHSPRN